MEDTEESTEEDSLPQKPQQMEVINNGIPLCH